MNNARATIAVLDHLESLWEAIDGLFDSFDNEDWSRAHGPDWTFADLPYHLAYFDRDLIGKAISSGSNVPPEGQVTFATLRELGGWNERMFARRPADQSVQTSVDEMRASRQHIRELVSGMDQSDLTLPAFVPLPGFGWVTISDALENCRAHTWGHVSEALIRSKRSGPLPSADATRNSVATYMGFLPRFADRTAAAALGKPFTAQMSVLGHGGGDWTINVNNGASGLVDGPADRADITMTFKDSSAFASMLLGIQNPMKLMLSRAIKIKGIRHIGTFGKLFPTPGPDTNLSGG